MDTLDRFVRYGTVTFQLAPSRTRVFALFEGKPFLDGVPANLSALEDTAELALERLWNRFVDALPQGFPDHIKEVSR